ncbi:HEAT repeat domain-containing protein, partial [bacterium]|nr:HEAT repeat domain-containing protein [bacterium]
MCAKAIANYKDTDAVTPLLYCLNNKDEHYKVRLSCADALGKIGDKYAVAPLIEVMKDEEEKSVYLRESAASALGLIGDMRALDPLVSILETKQGLMNKFTFLKERVIEALTKLRLDDNDRVFHALKSSLSDESVQVRINAIEALMESNHPEAVQTIKTCLDDNDEEVRKNALIALYNIEGRDILDEVISLPVYHQSLKEEAKFMIEEYEDD